MHENLCLQLEVDSKTAEIEKLKQKISRCDIRNELKYVNSKSKSNSPTKKEKKIVRIDSSATVITQKCDCKDSEKEKVISKTDTVTKIYERTETVDVPVITELKGKISEGSSSQITRSAKESMALMQVSSNGSIGLDSEIGSEPVRTQSAPEIVQSSIFSGSCKSCESVESRIKYYKYGVK